MTLHRSIGAVQFCVRSDNPRFLNDMASLYPANDAESSSGPRIDIDVKRLDGRFGTPRYHVFSNGEQVGGEHKTREVIPFLEWGINLQVITQYARFVQLHAATLAYNNQGVIFAGASGSGKSTLAAALLARGWDYFCDEFALIDNDTRMLHAFPKAICIKSGSFAAMKQLGIPFARRCDYIKANKGRVGYINPISIRSDSVATPTPVRHIFFPRYIPGIEPRLHEVSRARALIDLAACVFNRHVFPNYALDCLAPIIQNVRCYRLDVGSPTETARLLEETIGQQNQIGETSKCQELPRPSSSAVPVSRKPKRNPSRRDLLRRGAKIAYAAPLVLTLTSQKAFAAPSIPSGACSSGIQTGGLCNTDADCCTGDCDLGVCQ